MITVNGVGDPSQVRALGQIIASTATPDQNVVSQVPGNLITLLFGPSQGFAEESNVLVIPSVSVGNGGTVRYEQYTI